MILLAKNSSLLDKGTTVQSSSLLQGERSAIGDDVRLHPRTFIAADILEADPSADTYLDSPPRYSESETRPDLGARNETNTSLPIVHRPDYLVDVTVTRVPTGDGTPSTTIHGHYSEPSSNSTSIRGRGRDRALRHRPEANHRERDVHTDANGHAETDPEEDAEWREALKELQTNLTDLRNARNRASKVSLLSRATPGYLRPLSRKVKQKKLHDADPYEGQVRVLEELVLRSMRRLAHVHPSPAVQAEWAARAEEFERTLRVPAGVDVHGFRNEEGIETNPRERGRGRSETSSKDSGGLLGDGLFPKLKDTDSHVALMMKGTGYVVLFPIAVCGALVYGSLAVVYFSGKLVVKAGQKVVQQNDKP